MSTPYRIEYKNVVSINGGSDGYPLDAIKGEIMLDLPTIKNNPDKYIADIALEGEDYYGRKIDSYGNMPYDYLYEVDVENEIVVIHYSYTKSTVIVDLKKFDASSLNIHMIEVLNYGPDEIDDVLDDKLVESMKNNGIEFKKNEM